MKKLFCLWFVIFAVNPSFTAQEILTERKEKVIDSLMTIYMTKNKIPGASVSVVKGEEILLSKAYGMADIENFAPVTPGTLFRLASVSKPITAVAVMQLVEQGKIDLDAPVQKYVPDFPQKKHQITVRQLLAHTSGIRHYQGDEFLFNKVYSSLKAALDIFKNDSLLHKPGAQLTYSTYGYTLLGAVIESVSGRKFTDYLQEKVFIPAEMSRTMEDNPRAIIFNRSENYDTISGGIVVNSDPINSSYKIPGGGLISNVQDISNFLIALNMNRLLSRETWEKMTTETETSNGISTSFGLGWILGFPPLPGFPHLPDAVWHGGVQQGSTTAILLLPKEDLGIVILSNSGGFGDEVSYAIAQIGDMLKKGI
ncbi:serine hydrolase domain-containing protein [Salinimicrobium terrae]|uniref:serine hydrolase domain-containing protein n=1 Tax=Salinimicrobium terrae TaxID=470866 RepID=UPI0004052DDD|nr:serine hydrolase domain-containing protein [Salinimicrobium terrae]